MDNTEIGNKGEDIACTYLSKLGYKIIERNYRIRGGEVDIIAIDHEQIVFVEVKARYSHKYGLPRESITYWKIKALMKSSLFYLQGKNWLHKSYRLDFVGIDFSKTREHPEIELIKNITQ